MSGGKPPTNTLREKRSFTSDPCECGDDLAGDPIDGRVKPSTYALVSSEMWSSIREKYDLPIQHRKTILIFNLCTHLLHS